MKLVNKLKLCLAILLAKEYYAVIVHSYYNNGRPLGMTVIGCGKDTITYREKLINALKDEIHSIYEYKK